MCEEAKEKGAIIVCSDTERIIRKLLAYGICGMHVKSYQDFYNDIINSELTGPYVIDDIEKFLDLMCKNKVIAFTSNID